MVTGSCAVWILSVVSNGWFGCLQPEPSTESDAGVKAGVQQVEYLCGTWSREQGKDQLEEVWLAPRGDCMMGVFRWIKVGKVWMYELLTISEEKGSLVFRIRHFDRALKAWETEPLVYELKSIEKNRVVFEHQYPDHMDRFTYSRPDEKTYVVRLEETDGSKRKPQEFTFKRNE